MSYERYEGIRETLRMQLILPGRTMKYEKRPNKNDETELHGVYQSKPMKALELSVMTEDEILKLREFWVRLCDDALETVRELDRAARERFENEKVPSKRLYRTGAKLIIFPEEEGEVPHEWEPAVDEQDL